MITVLPEKDIETIKRIFAENKLEYKATSGVVTARQKEEILGFCLYYLDEKNMEILKIFPETDILLADGILRSALHVACQRFVTNATFCECMDSSVFEKLDFILDKENRTLNVDKLFGGCNCHKGE